MLTGDLKQLKVWIFVQCLIGMTTLTLMYLSQLST